MAQQFIRRVGLLVTTQTGNGVDFSSFRISFKVSCADVDHPNNAEIRIYNPAPSTINRIANKEFRNVTLSAGYVGGGYGVIFLGTVKQYRIGKIDAVTSYLDLLCADGDIAYSSSFIATSLSAGHTYENQLSTILAAQNAAIQRANPGSLNITQAGIPVAQLAGGTIPQLRGKVMYGMGNRYVGGIAATLGASYSIQQGKLYLTPYNGYQPGEIINLSQFSGVIGIPELTNEGLKLKCLLNPGFIVGNAIRLDNSLINQIAFADGNQLAANGGVLYNTIAEIALYATTGRDGLYRIYAVDFEGDTWGQPWYANLTCLAINEATNQLFGNPTGNANPVPQVGPQGQAS
jgi:hypothetical protein